jgi:preprotein translocase subunit SecG
MVYGLLLTLFVFICVFLVLIILIQQGKSNMGLGNLGGGAQMLFGGSGGQDIFQKTTWILGVLFMAGSLGLALMKSRSFERSGYTRTAPMHQSAPMEE